MAAILGTQGTELAYIHPPLALVLIALDQELRFYNNFVVWLMLAGPNGMILQAVMWLAGRELTSKYVIVTIRRMLAVGIRFVPTTVTGINVLSVVIWGAVLFLVDGATGRLSRHVMPVVMRRELIQLGGIVIVHHRVAAEHVTAFSNRIKIYLVLVNLAVMAAVVLLVQIKINASGP